MKAKIYLLRNPISSEVFYVGQTIYTLNQRLTAHISEKNKGIKNEVIKEIISQGLLPIIEELECCDYEPGVNIWLNERELFWIKHYNPCGNKLHVAFFVKTCPECKNDFEAKTDKSIYCSDKCRVNYYRYNKKERNTTPVKGVFKKNEFCEYCKEPLIAAYRNKRFCSDKCRVYFNRENKGNNPPIEVKDFTKPTNVVVPNDTPKSNYSINTKKEMPPGLGRVAQMRWLRENS